MNNTKRLHFEWVLGALFRPRISFPDILGTNAGARRRSTWLVPLLLLSVTGLILVFVTGWLQGQNVTAPELSPDFQYLSPEQQTQMMQALQMRQGPVFRYVFPALTTLLGIWVGWLLVGGLLHLMMTLQGGRGDASTALNLVAWCSLPYAVRDIVQTVFMVFTRQMITSPGLMGFISTDSGGMNLFLAKFLALVDIYLIWRLILMTLGVKAAAGFGSGKAFISALVSILIVLLLQVGLGYLGTTLGSLSIVRMFF